MTEQQPIDVTPQLEQILAQCNESREHHTHLGVLRAQVSGDIDQAIAILQHAKTQNRDKAEHAHAIAAATGRVKLLAEKALGIPPPPMPDDPPHQGSGLNKIPPTLPSFFFFAIVCATCFAIGASPSNHSEADMTVANSLIAQGDMEALKGNHRLAARAYRRVLTEHNDSNVLVKIADAEYHDQRFGEAVAACDRAIKLFSNQPAAYRVRGLARLEIARIDGGDTKDAKADLEMAAKLGDKLASLALQEIK